MAISNGILPSSQELLPPSAPEAEQGVCGCALLDPTYCLPILRREGIGPRHFSDLRYSALLTIIRDMHREGIACADDGLILPRLERAQVNLDFAMLQGLRDYVPSACNLEYYLPDLQMAFTRRNLYHMAVRVSSIVQDPQADIDSLTDAAEGFQRLIQLSSGSDDLPPIVDAFDLPQKASEKPAELVYGLLHRGSKLVLGGGSKSFKTWALIDLGMSVSHGEPWLSHKTAKGRVLYVNLELQDWSFSERVKAVASAKNLTLEPGLLEVWNLRGKSAPYHLILPKIRERVKDSGYALIILDPCYKLLGDLDENSAGDIAKLLNAIEELSVSTGAAVAFGAHFSKGNQSGKEAIDRISGSGVFARDPDSILVLTKHEQEGAFAVESILRNFKPLPPFVVRWDFPLFRCDGSLDPAKLKQMRSGRTPSYSEKDILEVLPVKGLSTKDWLEKAAQDGITRATFFRLMKSLRQAGAIAINEKEKWEVSKVS